MARHRRMYFHKSVYHISIRTSEGLPFVCNLLFKFLLGGILARGKSLYPNVKICAWLFMGNHFHAIVVNQGATSSIPDFMEFVNGEIAKAINRLRGRRNFKVWATRYKTEQLLTYDSVIQQFVYLFMNPVRVNLVTSIYNYPGFSTWREFLGHPSRTYQYFSSSLLSKLPLGAISTTLSKRIILGYRKEAAKRNKTISSHELTIEPFAWMECFDETANWTEEMGREKILSKLAEEEKLADKERAKLERTGKSVVLGSEKLKRQCFFKTFTTANFSSRSLCKSTCNVLRDLFKATYKEFCEKCRECWIKSQRGLFYVEYPPGAFTPGGISSASLLQFGL